jgi:hypothetical protein
MNPKIMLRSVLVAGTALLCLLFAAVASVYANQTVYELCLSGSAKLAEGDYIKER